MSTSANIYSESSHTEVEKRAKEATSKVTVWPIITRHVSFPQRDINAIQLPTASCNSEVTHPPMESDRTADETAQRALRRIQRLSLHLSHPSSPSNGLDLLYQSQCSGGRRPPVVNRAELTEFMRGPHREIQERLFEFFNARPELQTPVEISMAEHRELCMRQLTALVREAGVRPLKFVLEDPSLYFSILETAGGIDISLGIKMGVQYR